MTKKEIILPEKRYAKAPTEELSIQVNLEKTDNLLTNDDRDIVLNNNDLFTKERNESLRYKIYGKIKMVFRNMYKGSALTYPYLADRLSLSSDGLDGNFDGYLPYNEFAFIRNDVVTQTPLQDASYTSLSGFTGFDMITSGLSEHAIITPINAPYYNWNLYLSYVYSGDTEHKFAYTLSGDTVPMNFKSGDGIPFRISDDGNQYKLTSPVDHGMNEGEYVIIENNLYYINGIGDERFRSEDYVINIFKSQIASGVTTFSGNLMVTGKRCIDNKNVEKSTSQYYVHKHKTLTTLDDYNIDKIGFESSIWADEKKTLFRTFSGRTDAIVERNRMESIIYDFKDPFILTGLTNNLGYTPTNIYVTTVFRNGNGFFDYPPKVGFSFNFHECWIDQHFIDDASDEKTISGTTFNVDGSGIDFISGDTLPVGTILTGSFIEYNPLELKERVISPSFYKIVANLNVFDHKQDDPASFYGSSYYNRFGLFYQAHYSVKLRELSSYVERSNDINIDNLPQNAKYYADEKMWKWRDLYDHGYIDDLGNGTNHPFINNTHYVRNDVNFYLRNEVLYIPKDDGIYDFNKNRRTNKNSSKDPINC